MLGGFKRVSCALQNGLRLKVSHVLHNLRVKFCENFHEMYGVSRGLHTVCGPFERL